MRLKSEGLHSWLEEAPVLPEWEPRVPGRVVRVRLGTQVCLRPVREDETRSPRVPLGGRERRMLSGAASASRSRQLSAVLTC